MDRELFDFMKKTIGYGYAIGYLPYKLVSITTKDDETGEVIMETRKWVADKSWPRTLFFYYTYICWLFYEVYLVWRTLEAYWDENEPVKEKLITFYFTGAYLITNFFHWVTIKHYGEQHHFYNNVVESVNCIAEIQGKDDVSEASMQNNNNDQSHRHFRGKFRLFSVLIPCIGLARAILVFKNPGAKQLITSMVHNTPADPDSGSGSDSADVPIWIKILGAAFHFHLVSHAAFELAFQPLSLIWFEAAVTSLIKELRVSREDGPRSANLEGRLYHSYHCLCILQKYGNQMFSIVPLGAEAAAIFIGVINIFIGVVHHEYSAFMRLVGLAALFGLLFKKLAQIYEESKIAIESWTNRGDFSDRDNIVQRGRGGQPWRNAGNWFHKFQRACQPLPVSVGGFFYIDNLFSLTLLEIIISNSTDLIISYRE